MESNALVDSGKGKKGAPPSPPKPGKGASTAGRHDVQETNQPSDEAELRRAALCTALKTIPFFDAATDDRAFHGRAYVDHGPMKAPAVTWASDRKPREHSAAWLTATEYEDESEIFKAKVELLAFLLRISHKTVAYSGAGLSVAAGVRMAAHGSAMTEKTPRVAGKTGQDEVRFEVESIPELGDKARENDSSAVTCEIHHAADNAKAGCVSKSEAAPPPPKSLGKGQVGYSGKGKPPPPPPTKYTGKGKASATSVPDLTTEAEPTSLHYVMADLNRQGMLHGWIQQNHDALPQKAGYRQEDIVEIHGSWYDPSNQVVKYSGGLRDDVYNEMCALSQSADLCLVMGTSLTGLTSDMVASKTAIRSQYGRALGTVIISPQRTSEDGKASLRIFAKAEAVMQALVAELGLMPLFSTVEMFPHELRIVVPYGSNGVRSTTMHTVWNLQPTQKVHLGSHHNSQLANQPDFRHLTCNDEAEVLPMDRMNFCIPLKFSPAPGIRGQLTGSVILRLGVWWLSAAQRGGVARLPVVNVDAEEATFTPELA